MADDVLHAAVVQQDVLVLEAAVAAHRGVVFDRFAREAPPARYFVPFWAALLMPLAVTARREQLPESLRPRLVATLGSPKTLQQQECEALRTLGRSALDAGLGKKFRREDS